MTASPALKQILQIPPVQKNLLCIEFELSSKRVSANEMTLLLTLDVFPQPISTPFGEIEVALRRFQLELNIENGRMPIRSRKPRRKLATEVKKTVTVSRSAALKLGRSDESSATGGFSVKGPMIGTTIKTSDQASDEQSGSLGTQFVRSDCQLVAGGFEDFPIWYFRDEEERNALHGGVKDEDLGVLEILGTPCKLSAEVTATNKDVLIFGRSNFLPDEIGTNRKIVKLLIMRMWVKVRPHLNMKIYEVQ